MPLDCLNCGTLNQVLQGPTCAPGDPDCVNWYDLAALAGQCGTCTACPNPDVPGPPCPPDYTIDPLRPGCCRPVAGFCPPNDPFCKPPHRKPRKPPGFIPPPCTGLNCGPGGGGFFPVGGIIEVVGCAPCEDGHVPALPDCDCGAGPHACCIDPANPLPGFAALSCCVDKCIAGGLNAAQCILGPCANPPPLPPCPKPQKTFTSQVIELGGGGQQQQCGAGEHPAPCDIGETLDLSTGCCSLPGNVLEIGGGTLEIPAASAGGASGAGGGAFQLPPPSAESDFLAAIAA